MMDYVELQVTSNYSFLRGASHPDELVSQASTLGHTAIAITDRNTLAGVVRAHVAAKQHGIQLIVGTRLDLEDAPSLLCLPTNREAYGCLSQLLTLGKRRAEKGTCQLFLEDVLNGETFKGGKDQIIIALPPETPLDQAFNNHLLKLRNKVKKNLYIAVKNTYYGNDNQKIEMLSQIAKRMLIPLVAVNDVHAHVTERRALQDVLTCIREHCTIHDAGFRLQGNAERHLKPAEEMIRLFTKYPDAIANTQRIAARCQFNLDELCYEYPINSIKQGRTTQEELKHQTQIGMKERYPGGVPHKVREQIKYELKLINQLSYAPYFLTVHDIVRFARSRSILCQGRGSAANSAVCYVLGITSVDPAHIDILFERFVSAERDEPPDIDIDFENERREEVYQYIYEKYGRDHAGITATHITYRSRSAFREIGKVMGLSEDNIQALSSSSWGKLNKKLPSDEFILEAGLNPKDLNLRMVLALTLQITGFPRHLSQHTGGFVITKNRLDSVVPIENAAMKNRTVIEWDKNDLDALGILKIDILALGMLTCIRKAFELIERHHAIKLTLANIPADDKATYDMLCLGDSVGVFQVESRAQMNMLPRLKPRCFYDLVIQVAIVRPGPIQGDMVHPYLRRRSSKEEVKYPSENLKKVLEKTKGIPLFQEQAMQIAIVAAGFTPSEADGLRRAMATFQHTGNIQLYHNRMIKGMVERGYETNFAERCFKQIEGFGKYGFPESHAASFALLVYASSWLKCHYPAAFAAALLNSQPMGFYKPAQIVRDAQAHGVVIQEIDVNNSEWDYTLEFIKPTISILAPTKVEDKDRVINKWRHINDQNTALRIGFRQIKGFQLEAADDLVSAREGGYWQIPMLKDRTQLKRGALEKLANADCFQSLGLDRRQALWAVNGLDDAKPLPLFTQLAGNQLYKEPSVKLPNITLGESVVADYKALRLSLKSHPMALLRNGFAPEGIITCAELSTAAPESIVRLAGIVLIRQRPGSAKGVIFITLEDETGIVNLIVWPHKVERYRRTVIGSYLLGVEGKLQREGIVTHILAEKLYDFSYRLGYLTEAYASTGENPASHKIKLQHINKKFAPGSRDFL
jgi:error-prone DNA polymerase